MPLVAVSYMELCEAPRPVGRPGGVDRIAAERLAPEPYLDLYRRVGGAYGWGARLRLPRAGFRVYQVRLEPSELL